MLSDPLFIKTQNELRHWRENKKSSREHIPHQIKDNIKKLNLQYSKARLRSALDLSGCSLHFLSGGKTQALVQEKALFVELPNVLTAAKKDKAPARIELDLPMNITLRIFL